MERWLSGEYGMIPVAADIQCDYWSQVYFDELLKIYVKVSRIGNSSVDLHYMEVREDGSICFTGRGAIVQVSKSSGKSVPWTEEGRNILLTHLSDENL